MDKDNTLSSSSLDVLIDVGYEIEEFTPRQIKAIEAYSEEMSDGDDRFKRSVSVVLGSLVQIDGELLEKINPESPDWQSGILELAGLEVVDIGQFMSEYNPALFDESDDPTSMSTSMIYDVIKNVKEYRNLQQTTEDDSDEYDYQYDDYGYEEEVDDDEEKKETDEPTVIDGYEF